MEHKEQLLLHLFYFFPSFETQWLEKKQTWNSTCFFHIHTCSPRPRIFNSSLQCQFLPLQRPRGDFSIPKNWLQCSHSYSTSKGSSLILLADLFSRSYTIKSTFFFFEDWHQPHGYFKLWVWFTILFPRIDIKNASLQCSLAPEVQCPFSGTELNKNIFLISLYSS